MSNIRVTVSGLGGNFLNPYVGTTLSAITSGLGSESHREALSSSPNTSTVRATSLW